VKPHTRSPISFNVHVKRLPEKGFPLTIEADEKQRAQLAAIHGLLAVERFRADLLIESWKRDGVRVSGSVEADIVQECVVTLEPLAAEIREDVATLFVPERSALTHPAMPNGEILLSPDGADSPDTYSGDTIDIGALAEEIFGLAIDPYPRKDGVSLQPPLPDSAPETVFAKLLKAGGKTE
jgi:hypothetical protein